MSDIEFSKWIQEQYDNLEARMKQTGDIELVKLISKYRGYNSVTSYIVSVIRAEIKHYREDLRFERWLEQRGEVDFR